MKNRKIVGFQSITTLTFIALFLCAQAAAASAAWQSGDQHSSHGHHDSKPLQKRAQKVKQRPASTQRRASKVKQQAAQKTKLANTQETVYSCPMHPDITSNKPGACPKCAMALVAKTSMQAGDNHAGDSPAHSPGHGEQPQRWEISTARLERIAAYDQHGRRLNLYNDLIKSKTVAINFVPSPCAGNCVPLASFREAQRKMGERLGPFVKLITIFTSETPTETGHLQQMAAEHEAGAAWALIAINKTEVEQLLRAFGRPTPLAAATSSTLIVGNEAAGYWTQLDAAVPVATLIKAIDDASTRDPEASGTTSADSLPRPQ